MKRQLDDAEIKDSASIVIRNLAITGFPDNMLVNFDISNVGPTRAESVSLVQGFRWIPGRDVISAATNPGSMMYPNSPSDFGFALDPAEQRHIEMPIAGADPSDFPENARAWLPTSAQLISGEFTSVIDVTATYKTIFGRTQHVGDCLVYVQQQFRHCWGTSKRLGVRPEDRG
jgi:hypothetical protein